MPFVSVIVPVHRDEAALARLLTTLAPDEQVEVIVSRCAVEKIAPAVADGCRPDVRWVSAPRGRGTQMNAGAAAARGDWLLFLHADSVLPEGWLAEIAEAQQAGAVGGWFRFGLDSPARAARLLEICVAWRVRLFTLPYGDQGLFVRRDVFAALGGYRSWPLMEDVELVGRLVRLGRVHQAGRTLVTSARRWEQDGWLARSARNVAMLTLYRLGVSPVRLARWYER